MKIPNDINKLISQFKSKLRMEQSFDLIYRTINLSNHLGCIFFIDGFVKDTVMEKMLEFFYSAKEEDFKDADHFSKSCVPYVEVSLDDDIDTLAINILSGMLVLAIDGFDKAIAIDVRTYPARETSEPERDKTLLGSRDGFVETLVSNTALIRRRIRNSQLTMSILSVGSISKTDVVLCYMEDKVDQKLLKKIKHRIENANIDSLTMNQQSLMEAIYKYNWFNPFPKFKYSERPDSAAASIIEGNIVILVDNSPSCAIIPTSIFDIMEEADDFYFPPITGTYLRLSRYLISFITLILTPLWLLSLQNPEFVPEIFKFTLQTEPVSIPIFWQLILLEIAIDGMRLASINTPSSLSTSLSVIAGIVLSDFAVKSGWFNVESLLYMAFVAVANYSQPSYELGYALKFLRILLLIATVTFNIWGFFISLILIFIAMMMNKTISEKSYLYPLIPFNAKKLSEKIFRKRSNHV